MRVLLLAAPNSSHTIKWANSFQKLGIKIGVFGLSGCDEKEYDPEIDLEIIDLNKNPKNASTTNLKKLVYLKTLPKLKKFINNFRPDVVHAHYASSYGLLGALSGKHPYFISVWGTDILEFPKDSIIRKWLILFNLKQADEVFVTSKFLGEATQIYISKNPIIVPFGVDSDLFKPTQKVNPLSIESLVIGTIKTLEPVYGIDTLIKAFKIVKDKLSSSQLKLLIVGEGNQRKELDCLVANLSLEDSVIFTGYVPSSQIVEYFHKIDIFVNLSIRESFGVSVLEALACKIPVIVSDVGGLKEIVINNECGFLVEPNNVMETAVAMEKLIMDKEKRNKFGDAGRIRVKKYFEWNKNLSDVVKVYEHYLK